MKRPLTRFSVPPLHTMTRALAAVAMGRSAPDLVLTGARVLSTYTERVHRNREVWIKGGRIAAVKPGNRVGDISAAIQAALSPQGYGIVRDFVGHGVGRQMHEEPQIPNFGKAGTGPKLLAGMALAIEPMVNLGTHKIIMAADGWTARTADGKVSAHFEHTVLVTEKGAEILTLP